MEKVFNESHLEVLNRMFTVFINETVEDAEKRADKCKGDKFNYVTKCPSILFITMEGTCKNSIDLILETTNNLSDKVLFYDLFCKKGKAYFRCMHKGQEFVNLTKGYKYNPKSSTIINLNGTHIVSGVTCKNAISACKIMRLVLDKNEAANCTFEQLIERASEFKSKG